MIIALSDIHQNKPRAITIHTPRFKAYSCVCHEGNTPTELQLISLYLLMYADDMVLFSESISELQNM